MSHRRRSLAALALVVTLASCGSDDGGTASTEPSTTAGSSAAVVTTTAADKMAAVTSTAADKKAASGANPGVETLANGQADAAHTVTFTADKKFEPATLQVAPGELFTFVAAAGAPTSAVTFNGNDTYTIKGGLIESFTLKTPGTYTVSEFLTGAKMTVTVKG